MKRKNLLSLFWGLALILAGGVFLASNYGLLPDWNNNATFWMTALGLASLVFFASYAYSAATGNPKDWGWLVPACITAGTAITIYLGASQVTESAWIAFPVLFGTALPFLLGYLIERDSPGLLIPFWVIAVIAGLTLFVDRVQGEIIPLYVMLAIAIPFWVAAFAGKRRPAMLIPAGVLTLIGIIPIMTTLVSERWMASAIMWLIALPFVVTALYARQNWWAQIPAGVMISVGIMIAIIGGGEPSEAQAGLFLGALFVGIGLTFGLLWLQRRAAPTDWAKYPAAGLLLAAAVAFAFGAEAVNIVWPVVLIAAGLLMLYGTMRPKHL